MPLTESLTHKIGPLPVWAWGGIGAAGLFFMMSRNKGSSAASPNMPGNPQMVSSADAGAAMGGAQLANIYALSSDTNQQLQALLDKQGQNDGTGFTDLLNQWGQYLTLGQRNIGFILQGHPELVVGATPPGGVPYWSPGGASSFPTLSGRGGEYTPERTGGGGDSGYLGPPVRNTSALTPAYNAPYSYNYQNPWLNGAPNPDASMYRYSPN